MNQEYVYEDEQDEGLTFKKIWQFFKRGWLRMAIYIVIAVLLTTAIAVPIKTFLKSEPVAQTSIEYIYEGIEEGLDPNGALLNTDNIISTTVLAKAVAEANLGDTISDISMLRNAMRVEGVLTDEYVSLSEAAANGDTAAANTLRNYDMHSTRFNIVISNPSGIGLSDDQAKTLLNKVVACYYEDFKTRYSVRSMFAENMYVLSQNESLEFIDIYDIYVQSLDSVKSFLQGMKEVGSNFVSTANETTFTQLLSETELLGLSYNQFNASILSNNIWRNKQSAQNALASSKIDINNKLEPLRSYIEVLTKQIANIQPNTTTTDSTGTHTITLTYPAEYFIYQAQLDEANRQVRDYDIQLKNIDTRLENIEAAPEADEAQKSKAVATLVEIEAQTLTLIKKVNATVADYYDTTFVSSSVRQVQPPVVTRRGMGFSLLIVYALAVIVALIVAGIVTAIKQVRTKNNAAKQEKPATEPDEQTK